MAHLWIPTIMFPSIFYSVLGFDTARKLNLAFDAIFAVSLLAIGRLLPSLRRQLPTSPTHLAGKTAIVTGANSGVGRQVACDLASLGARVILACRTTTKGEEARKGIIESLEDQNAGNRIEVRQLDTSKLQNVTAFAEEWKKQFIEDQQIDILMHNAGIASIPPTAKSDYSEDGLELIYATNVLGAFLLTYHLEENLSSTARVAFTSSTGQYSGSISTTFSEQAVKKSIEPGFHSVIKGPTKAGDFISNESRYGMSKAMQCAMARALQRRWNQDNSDAEASERVAHSFSPGFTSTPIFGNEKLGPADFRREPLYASLQATLVLATDVSEGAATGSWLASTADSSVKGKGNGGRYWDRCVPRISSAELLTEETLDRLWRRWEADANIKWK